MSFIICTFAGLSSPSLFQDPSGHKKELANYADDDIQENRSMYQMKHEIKCCADIGENNLPKNESYQWINVCRYLGCNQNNRNKCR